MKTIEQETIYQAEWPWTDEQLDMINYHAHRLGKVLVETLGEVIEYEIGEEDAGQEI